MENKEVLLSTILITAFIFLVFGYIWGRGSTNFNYDYGHVAGIEEMTVVWKEEICK